MNTPRFQIISDLHLETPVQSPSYSYFSSPANFPLLADLLFLLGDIGLITHASALLRFLRSLLSQSASLRIFYVPGNHECYHTTLDHGLSVLQSWEPLLNAEFGPSRFHIMTRRRIDIDDSLTLLGCTLWTHIPAAHVADVTRGSRDFDDAWGMWNRSVHEHNADHARDLAWLNGQVESIEREESHKHIIVLTHHSPTIDPQANSARFPPERPMNSAFRTDLSGEKCWTSRNVTAWAFGHTHFNCQFVDTEDLRCEGPNEGKQIARRKLVVANQKGYAYPEGAGNWKIEPVVIGREDGMWKVIVGGKEN